MTNPFPIFVWRHCKCSLSTLYFEKDNIYISCWQQCVPFLIQAFPLNMEAYLPHLPPARTTVRSTITVVTAQINMARYTKTEVVMKTSQILFLWYQSTKKGPTCKGFTCKKLFLIALTFLQLWNAPGPSTITRERKDWKQNCWNY